SGTLIALGAVKFVVAYAEVGNAGVEHGTQPLLRIFRRCGPVSISHDAGLQPRVVHHSQPCQQNRVEQKWLAAFQVNGVDRVNLLDLVQEFAKLAEGKGPLALWPAVQKAVIALSRALVGEQDVDRSQHDVLPLGAGERKMSSRIILLLMVLLDVEFVCDLCTPCLGTKSPFQHLTGNVPPRSYASTSSSVRPALRSRRNIRWSNRPLVWRYSVAATVPIWFARRSWSSASRASASARRGSRASCS